KRVAPHNKKAPRLQTWRKTGCTRKASDPCNSARSRLLPAASILPRASLGQSPSRQKTRLESRPGKTKTSSSEVSSDLRRTGGKQTHSNSSVHLYKSPRNLDAGVVHLAHVLRFARGRRHREESSRASKSCRYTFQK